MTRAQEILRTLGEIVGGGANARTVYGEPVTAGDRTIIPVARVRFGMGAGGGGLDRQNPDGTMADRGGGGGGCGVNAAPVGIVEITAAGTRLIRFSRAREVTAALAFGLIAGIMIGRAGRRKQ
jgi:uncharacterized spore protein YtfJ